MENYTPFGKEWETEMNKLPKAELIKMIRKLQTGTEDKKIMLIETAEQAIQQVEGIINDYEGGIIDKPETIRLLGEYTGRIMEIFWKNAKLKAIEELALIIHDVAWPREPFHCELYDFVRRDKPCDKQCDGCKAMNLY